MISLNIDRKIPDYLLDRKEGNTRDIIYKAIEEWDKIEIHDRAVKILNDLFILTASQDGLSSWEAHYADKPETMPYNEWRQLLLLVNDIVVSGPTEQRINNLVRFFDSTATLTKMASSKLYAENTTMTDLSEESTILSETSTIAGDSSAYDNELLLLRSDTELYQIGVFTERAEGYAVLLRTILNKVLPANVHVVIGPVENSEVPSISPTLVIGPVENSEVPSISTTPTDDTPKDPVTPLTDSFKLILFKDRLSTEPTATPAAVGIYDWESQKYTMQHNILIPGTETFTLCKASFINTSGLLFLWYRMPTGLYRIYLYDIYTKYYGVFIDNVHNYAIGNVFHAVMDYGLVIYDPIQNDLRIRLFNPIRTSTGYSVVDGYYGLFSFGHGEAIVNISRAAWAGNTDYLLVVTSAGRAYTIKPYPHVGETVDDSRVDFSTSENNITEINTLRTHGARFYAVTKDCFVGVSSAVQPSSSLNRILTISKTNGEDNPPTIVDDISKNIDLPIGFLSDRMILMVGYSEPDNIYAPKIPYKQGIPMVSAGSVIDTLDTDYKVLTKITNSSKHLAIVGYHASGYTIKILKNFMAKVYEKEGITGATTDTYTIETRAVPALGDDINNTAGLIGIYKV